jgi:YhgE/Pip-like protein
MDHPAGPDTPRTEEQPDPYQVRAKDLLTVRAIWAIPLIVGSVLIVLITGFYIGSVVDPVAHLHGLPVSVVNEDAGATIGGRQVDLGAQLQSGLIGSRTVSRLLALTPQPISGAESRMNRNGSYATLVIPPDFTTSLLALTGLQPRAGTPPGKPTTQLLANVRAGTVGVSLAAGVLEPAIARASRQIGQQLLTETRLARTTSSAPVSVLADPITFTRVDYRPLPPHSALGLSAFYTALLTIMCGFLGATIINAAVDAATGYATTEVGPRWVLREPLPINRWQTLLAKWTMALVLTAMFTGLVMVVAIGILDMDAPNAGYLWLFTWLAAASVAAGTLALLAVLGTQGQLVALLLFVYFGLASAGGTVPLEALPGFLKLASEIEPFRQILDGTRAILYFGAAGDAGLTRGIVTATAGLIFWLALGVTVVRWYDRKGLHRLRPDLLAYIHRAVSDYRTQTQPPVQTQEEVGPSR